VNTTVRYTGGEARLSLSGELYMSTTQQLHDRVAEVLARTHPESFVIDAVDLDFCDSSGVQALVQTHRAVTGRGIGFRLTNARGMARRVLTITGVLHVLTGGPGV
jgi:anti-sigma B factor antagonist